MKVPVPIPPPKPAWRQNADRHLATFLTGLLFLLPFILTLMILDWLIRQVAGFFGPETLIGTAMTSGGALIFGDATLGFWLLLAFVLAGIWGVGYVFQTRAKRSIERRLDAIIDRIPVIGSVYRPIAQFVRMIDPGKGRSEITSMRAVAVSFGGGVDTLALQVSPNVYTIGGNERLLILIPTAPVPMGGAMLFMPVTSVQPVEGLGVEDLMKFYISMGTMTPGAAFGQPELAPT